MKHTVAFCLTKLRRLFTSAASRRPVFGNSRQVYDFCRQIYNTSGGPTPALRKLYEDYRADRVRVEGGTN